MGLGWYHFHAVVAPNKRDSTSLLQKVPTSSSATTSAGRKHHATDQHAGGVERPRPAKTGPGVHRLLQGNPGKISFASSGTALPCTWRAELFKVMTKCDMVGMCLIGIGDAFPRIISNKVQLIFDNLPSALEQARGGTVARSAYLAQAWPGVPDVPAIRTVPGFESVGFYGIFPAKGHAA